MTAENEKRRPPLCTLATRLIWTTRSSSESLLGSMRATGVCPLEVEAGLAGRLGERANPPVVLEARPVEHDLLDAGLLRALGDELADALGVVRLRAGRAPEARLDRRGGRDGAAARVVDDLGVDVGEAAEHREARALPGAGEADPDPLVTLDA